MSELVSDRTQGRHRMIVYPGGVLGEQEASFEQTRTGGIDINRSNMAPLVSFIGKADTPADQTIFRNAARDSSMFLRGLWKNWEGSVRKQAQDLGVTVIEIDRKPLEAVLRGLYPKFLTDSHSRYLVESIQKDQ
jgi:TRAP-type C4-dicarboxylate transport system substrate-binding protein